MYWVSIRAEFQCRACGHLSPLNFLDLDGSVRCLRCGLDQAFAQSSWQKALEHCHAVGDLGGDHPEGRYPHPALSIASVNPFRGQKTGTHTQTGIVVERGMQIPTSLRVTAEISDPVCEKCEVAVAIQTPAGGQTRTTCPRCGENRSYALHASTPKLAPAARAVVAEEHRSDSAVARIESNAADPGAIAILCASCGGGLQVASGARIVTCQYCRTSSRIPQKTMYRSGHEAPQVDRWWVAFDGPSLMRKKLERDPGVPPEPSDAMTDLKVEAPPKRKRMSAVEWMTVALIPLLMLLGIGAIDFLVGQALDLAVSF